MSKRALVIAGVLVCLAVAFSLNASKTDAESEIRAAVAKRLAAYNSHNGQELASFYASDGDMMTLDGRLVQGRPAIEKDLIRAHDEEAKNATGTLSVLKIRLLSRDLAIVDVSGTAKGVKDKLSPTDSIELRITYILKKSHGQWENVAYRPMIVQR